MSERVYVFIVSIILATFAAACSSSTTPGSDAGADGTTDGGGDGGGDGSGGDAGQTFVGALGFQPSNVPPSTPFEPGPALTVSGTCAADGEKGTLCGSGAPVKDVGGVAVFTLSALTVGAGNTLQIVGTKPVAIVVTGDATIDGSLEALPGKAGGAGAPMDHQKGGGMGGGGPFDVGTTTGAGGGGFCGKGGAGGTTGGPAANGGATYGTASLVPLVGGSAGGGSLSNGVWGAGGGAVQLSAKTITIGSSGVVWAGGGGGRATGGGGGSGGAILLEAEVITIAGTLAANGGGGGGNYASISIEGGEDGQKSAVAAKGSLDPLYGNVGGDGAAAAVLDGKPGVYTGNIAGGQENGGGGGGGGAGRIRLNTRSGTAQITGTVSPSMGTACATQGTLGG
jgi:hypothetical protein